MRQVSIKILRARLTSELKNLPFEVTKNGKKIAVVTRNRPKMAKSVNIEPEAQKTTIEAAKEKLSEIIEKKTKADKPEATFHTGGVPVFGYPKSVQCRKKIK